MNVEIRIEAAQFLFGRIHKSNYLCSVTSSVLAKVSYTLHHKLLFYHYQLSGQHTVQFVAPIF